MKKEGGLSEVLIEISVATVLIFMILMNLNFINASFQLGKNSTNIATEYGPGALLTGKINISINNEPFDSILKANFGSDTYETTLKEFLDNAGSLYNCSTYSCDSTYAVSDSTGNETKKFALASSGELKNEMIGIKITGKNIVDISGFSLGVSSNSQNSCINPLQIDILNDGSYEWIAYNPSSNFCQTSNNGYGCYESAKKEDDAFITTAEYCSKIKIPGTAMAKIGADIIGVSSDNDFMMAIFNENYSNGCEFSSSASGEKGCVVPLGTINEQEFDVCISAKTSSDANKYHLGFETHNPCGYAGDEEKDFAIFARPNEYASVGNFVLNTEEIQNQNIDLIENKDLEAYLSDYISDYYNGDCSSGCIIPINFTAGVAQNVVLSNLSLFYESSGGVSVETKKLFDLSLAKSLISKSFSLLDLSKAGLQVPDNYGDYELKLTLGSSAIVEDFDIEVINAPVIETVYPQKAPAAMDISFRAYTVGGNITSYKWNFGDNSSIQTTISNSVIHRYKDIGKYKLELTTKNSLGESKKSFDINILNPEEYIIDILNKSQGDIDNVRKQIEDIPSWLKSFAESKINLTAKEAELNKLKVQYESAEGSSAEYIDILNSLEELNIPSSFEATDQSSLKFTINPENINLAALEDLGAGKPNNGSSQAYKDAIAEWNSNYVDINVEEIVYSLYSKAAYQPLISKYIITLGPKPEADLQNVYFVVNAGKDDVKFADGSLSVKEAGQSVGVLFSRLDSEKIELAISGGVSVFQTPIYLSPSFSELSDYVLGTEIDVCNNDNECEKSRGENWENCRHDCKPIGSILKWLIILLLIALCLYIALQEWYKKKYEGFLFKNKNDLFNLINFIDNAEKQGLKKEEIFRKLLDKMWANEQIIYAWKKYKGQRTGMWEIPVFKIFENIKVKRELEKRKQAGVTGKIVPIPYTRLGSGTTR